MTEVKLYGHLGKKFGKSFLFDVNTPRQAISALRANFPGFTDHLLKNDKPGYWVVAGKEDMSSENKINHPVGRRTIKIIPVVQGAKKSPIFGIIFGVGLALIGGPIGAATGFGTLGTAITAIGVSMALTGIGQLLVGNPNGNPNQKEETKANTNFSGPVNVTIAGGPVPLVYGEVLAGSVVVSSGISSDVVKSNDQACFYDKNDTETCTVVT